MNAEIARAFGHNGFPSMQTFGGKNMLDSSE
jgi:hypothetical protein